MKVKIFRGVNTVGSLVKISSLENVDAESEINEFLKREDIEIIDIKLSAGDTRYTVLIMYKEI